MKLECFRSGMFWPRVLTRVSLRYSKGGKLVPNSFFCQLMMNTLSMDKFPIKLKSVFKKLLFNEAFSDVTLVTDDLTKLPAHKIVLSALSPVLETILSLTEQPGQVIFLRGVMEEDLRPFLHFLYEGEVAINQDKVSSFIKLVREMGVIEEAEQSTENKDLQIEALILPNLNIIGEEKQNMEEVEHKEEIIEKEKSESHSFDLGGLHGRLVEDPEQGVVNQTGSKANHACKHCNLTFTMKKLLFEHIDKVHEGVKYFCIECEYSSSKWDNLSFHRKKFHENIFFSCNLCKFKTMKKHMLREHQQSEHVGIRFPCRQCDYIGKHKQNLMHHMKNYHENITIKCKTCGFEADGPNGLKRHKRKEHWVKIVCDQCEYQTPDKSALREHIEIKHAGIRYKCKFCNLEVVNLKSLKKHQKLKHAGYLKK